MTTLTLNDTLYTACSPELGVVSYGHRTLNGLKGRRPVQTVVHCFMRGSFMRSSQA
jgi:hypothetical protein